MQVSNYGGNRSSSKALQRLPEAFCNIRPTHQPQAASMDAQGVPYFLRLPLSR